MQKKIVVAVCLACVLIGCTKTVTRRNPLYSDCSDSLNDARYVSGLEAKHGAVSVSARAGQCYWSTHRDDLAIAKAAALDSCKSAGNTDCAIFAEDTKTVLQPTIKETKMDWGSTFLLAGGALLGAAAYQSGKSGGYSTTNYSAAASAYVPPTPRPVAAYVPPPTVATTALTLPSTMSPVDPPKPHSVPSTIQCLQLVDEWRGGISTESATIRNKCNQKVGFVYCVVSSKAGGVLDCRDNRTGADTVRAGGTQEISVMDANQGRLEVAFAECVNPDPDSNPFPKDTHFNGAHLVFDGCAF